MPPDQGDGSDTHYLQVTGDSGMGSASLSCGAMSQSGDVMAFGNERTGSVAVWSAGPMADVRVNPPKSSSRYESMVQPLVRPPEPNPPPPVSFTIDNPTAPPPFGRYKLTTMDESVDSAGVEGMPSIPLSSSLATSPWLLSQSISLAPKLRIRSSVTKAMVLQDGIGYVPTTNLPRPKGQEEAAVRNNSILFSSMRSQVSERASERVIE